VVFVFHATSNCSKEGIRVGKGWRQPSMGKEEKTKTR
jgi:hypothetical protein